ncbi:MAG: SufD family Fe-S cluster assembly protein [Candidatus Micrarchaeaceae archaeon]
MGQYFGDYSEILQSRKELYKRYGIGLSADGFSDGKASSPLQFKAMLEHNTRINFGALVSASATQSSNGVEVARKGTQSKNDISSVNLNDEQAVAAFIDENSVCEVHVNAPENSEINANVLFVADSLLPVKIIVNAQQGSVVKLLEWFASDGKGVVPLQVINAGRNAYVDLSIVHNEAINANLVSLASATAGQGAVIQINSVLSGLSKAKLSTFAIAKEDASKISINSVLIINKHQAFDASSVLRSLGKNTTAQSKTGAVLFDQSQCLLKDFAKVDKAAVGAYSYVEERGLLLSSESNFMPLPDMSIDTRNVSFASHSASSTPLSKEHIFYMMSRGMSEGDARHSLTLAFLMHYLTSMSNAKIKEIAATIINDKMLSGAVPAAPQLSTSSIWQ